MTTMKFNRIGGEFTREWVKAHSECIKEYKGYSIVFGKAQRMQNGFFWKISIYKNSGKSMELEYRTPNAWATDAQAMQIETKLAKEFIDTL